MPILWLMGTGLEEEERLRGQEYTPKNRHDPWYACSTRPPGAKETDRKAECTNHCWL